VTPGVKNSKKTGRIKMMKQRKKSRDKEAMG
jgi:hypothetical protein